MKRLELLNFRIGIEEDGALACDAVETNLYDIMLKDLGVTKEQKEELNEKIENTYKALYEIGKLLDSFIPEDDETESEEK